MCPPPMPPNWNRLPQRRRCSRRRVAWMTRIVWRVARREEVEARAGGFEVEAGASGWNSSAIDNIKI